MICEITIRDIKRSNSNENENVYVSFVKMYEKCKKALDLV